MVDYRGYAKAGEECMWQGNREIELLPNHGKFYRSINRCHLSASAHRRYFLKRGATKKVKAHPACAAGNDGLEGHPKPLQPEVKRRGTSAAMIGLAISMGASSLLLTRHAHGALAADPVGNAPMLSTQTAAAVAAPYVQNLQTEIHRLWEKYPAQQTGINPQFRLAQAAQLLQPAIEKRSPSQVSSPIRATAMQPMATAPTDGEPLALPQSFWGRQVSPELPPLAAVDTYLPRALVPFKGYIWPAKGVVTSPFGWRWGRMHKGIDIAGPVGTPVFAAAPGVVVTAGWTSGGYGNLVDIQHADGSLTRYAHNYRILVQVGQRVEQGQEISEMGSTGYSTGPHCHFEVHPSGHGAVNPIAYLPR